jgi:nucleoside-diphosphate-sugar epimerase
MYNSLKNKNILITGGLGFIGSNLSIRLTELGASVTVIDSLIPEYGGNLWNIEPAREIININISDVRDEHSMKYLIQNQDVLFNLAGQTSHLDSMKNPCPDLEINARAQLFILEACRKHNPNIKIVFASTRQIYGVPRYLPVDERHPISPVDINGINKLAGEWYHIVYNNVYGVKSTVLRLTNTYGPRMRVKDARQTFLGIWIRRLIEGKPLIVYGDGKQVRDFNFIDDVVDAMLVAAISKDADGEIFNLGADDPINLQNTAELMVQVNQSGSYEILPFPPERKVIDIGDYYGDFRKIRSRLGWKPKTLFESGLERTLAFYREFHNYYWESDDAA